MCVCVCHNNICVSCCNAAIPKFLRNCSVVLAYAIYKVTYIQASVAFLALMHRNTQRLRRGRDASSRGPQVQEFGFQLLCQQNSGESPSKVVQVFWWLEAQKISHLAMHSKTTQIARWHACPCHKMTLMATST